MNALSAAWPRITRSPKRIAISALVAVAAVAAGVGFAAVVNGMRAPEGTAQASSASAVASAGASPTESLAPTVRVAATPIPTAPATPALATPVPATPTPAARATTVPPTPAPTAITAAPTVTGCDEIRVNQTGTILVNGNPLEGTPGEEYGWIPHLSVLRFAASASGVAGSDICTQVEVVDPYVIVNGHVEVCGDVTTQRVAPPATPPPPSPAPTMPPFYAEPTVAGVGIPDHWLDVNSYPLLEVADLAGVPACVRVESRSNDTLTTVSLDVCEMATLTADGSLQIDIGGAVLRLEPDEVHDSEAALPLGQAAKVGLDIRNYKDDAITLVSMAVRVSPDCP